MNALLGVGMEALEDLSVTMEWNGLKNNSRPLALLERE